tara:strand:- start:2072 stop:3076 length:1005 start_codon:yes stop_codon:yes gene_type:complete
MKKIFLILVSSIFLNATEWEINSGNFYYEPSVLEIYVGDTVTWLNDGGYHDVNAYVNAVTGLVYENPENFSFPPTSGPVIGSHIFTVSGTYNYNCSVGSHASLGQTGTIIVIESSNITGCIDPNAITCDDTIDTLYFPECSECANDLPCDNYYNPNATVDNGLCMYNDVPSDDQFIISAVNNGFDLDWSDFIPPVNINQYVLQRCVDFDGDSDGDGVLEYDICVMLLSPATFSQDTSYFDDYVLGEDEYMKYSLYVHYPNNNYWGSAFGSYYYDPVLMGDLNFDGVINVIDVVTLVNAILGTTLSSEQQAVADLNGDGVINVIDIVSIVNIIVG